PLAILHGICPHNVNIILRIFVAVNVAGSDVLKDREAQTIIERNAVAQRLKVTDVKAVIERIHVSECNGRKDRSVSVRRYLAGRKPPSSKVVAEGDFITRVKGIRKVILEAELLKIRCQLKSLNRILQLEFIIEITENK